ncbi:related to Pre-mRNA-splicing factor SPP2 [Ustilago trichophora]|uniref:Related to Pre-mRNA-splicing factor SPP2 n=1 Tax=Ustilago trichophora TaxID=86804 RepID=A0A5C3E346_9BASI|nr:related to Pre-mRNA-splicing factor SPP2 [Ustilago trichophora]
MAGYQKDKSSKPNTRLRAFGDSDDDDDDDNAHHPLTSSRHQEIVSFGRDGAQERKAAPAPAAPRVIPVASNLDWRQDRKQRLGMASNLQSLGPLVSMRRADSSAVPGSNPSSSTVNGDSNADAINTEAQKSGLELRKSKPHKDDSAEGSPKDDAQAQGSAVPAAPVTATEEAGTDQEALKALLAGEGAGSSYTGEPLVIHQESETEVLQHDIDTRPDAPTLDDYAATPIDQFGMALLRGMGWKEGMGAGKGGKGPQQAAEPKKRAALLGLGAKERPSGPSGLPSSSSRSYRSKDKRDYRYVPVAKGESRSASNGRSDASDQHPRDDRHSEDRPKDKGSFRDDHKRDRDDRHASTRDSSRHESSRSSHRKRSRSPKRHRDDDRDRHRDRRRDDRDTERRSHGSSRSEFERRSDRDRERDDRRRDHRR